MIETSETVTALYGAFVAAQAQMEGVNKSAKNPHFRSAYATLEEVALTARPILAQHGLAYTQAPGMSDGGVTVTTRLIHKSGEWMQSTICMPLDKHTPQAVGSAITYGCRYSLMAVLGLPPQDDDGEAAEGRHSPAAPKPKAKARQEDYPTLEAEIRRCETPDELRRWAQDNGARINTLPEDWRTNLREEYEDHMARLRTMSVHSDARIEAEADAIDLARLGARQ